MAELRHEVTKSRNCVQKTSSCGVRLAIRRACMLGWLSGIVNCRPNLMLRRPIFGSSKMNVSGRNLKSNHALIAAIISTIRSSGRRPRKRNVGGSREVRPRSGETIHTCSHAFRKSMFRTTPRSVPAAICHWPAAVCHWKGLDKMTTANRLKSKR